MVSWAGMFAYPCEVLSRGKKFATIKLLHQATIGRVRLKRGDIKRRVPLCAQGGVNAGSSAAATSCGDGASSHNQEGYDMTQTAEQLAALLPVLGAAE